MGFQPVGFAMKTKGVDWTLTSMKFLRKKQRLLRAFPRNVAPGRGGTPLQAAARNGSAEVVELLLAANAPVDVKNNGGRRPQFGQDRFG